MTYKLRGATYDTRSPKNQFDTLRMPFLSFPEKSQLPNASLALSGLSRATFHAAAVE
jgi:hypothetical protein